VPISRNRVKKSRFTVNLMLEVCVCIILTYNLRCQMVVKITHVFPIDLREMLLMSRQRTFKFFRSFLELSHVHQTDDAQSIGSHVLET
jgi:hypothetical protein